MFGACALFPVHATGSHRLFTPQAINQQLLDAALSPALPLGWIHSAADAHLPNSKGFYWNSLTGAAQYEHPNFSFVTGVAQRLNSLWRVTPQPPPPVATATAATAAAPAAAAARSGRPQAAPPTRGGVSRQQSPGVR